MLNVLINLLDLAISAAKVRISEQNSKGKLVFLCKKH